MTLGGNSILPFWNSELYVELSACFPFGRDYYPVSLSRFHSKTLERISRACFDLGGEFLFMASPQTGCVGNLPRENFFKASPDPVLNLGFIMTLAYSEPLEKAVIASMLQPEAGMRLSAGIAGCSLWSRGTLEGMTKVIAVAADEPFFDCTDYLKSFAKILDDVRSFAGNGNLSHYAERFGYSRFFAVWETDSYMDMAVSQALNDFEFDGTREIVGGSASADFPPFMGATINMRNVQVIEE